MALHWPTFFTRLGSAVVFAIIMMAGLLWNEWSFLALVALIQVLCLRDYFRLMGRIFPEEGRNNTQIWVQIIGVAFLSLLQMSIRYSFLPDFIPSISPGWHITIDPSLMLILTRSFWSVLLFVPTILLLRTILSEKRTLASTFADLASTLYIILPCSLFLMIYRFDPYLPLVLILCIWMNDTMAYLVGSFIGKTPFSKISPKKTWEGTAGGAILTIAGAAIAAWLIPGQSMPAYIAIALCAAIAGTAGDLLESKLKRLAGVKDSGTMMPGHGGALDRFDSLLVATPFAFSLLYLLYFFQ